MYPLTIWSACGSRGADGVEPRGALAGGVVLVAPVRGDGLGLGVELDADAAVHVQVALEGAAPAGEGEDGQRHRDRHVDAHLQAVIALACHI